MLSRPASAGKGGGVAVSRPWLAARTGNVARHGQPSSSPRHSVRDTRCGPNTPNVCVFVLLVIIKIVAVVVAPRRLRSTRARQQTRRPGYVAVATTRSTSSASHRPVLEMWTTTKTTKYGVGKSFYLLSRSCSVSSSPAARARARLCSGRFGSLASELSNWRRDSPARPDLRSRGVTARSFARDDPHDGRAFLLSRRRYACTACALTTLRACGCPCVCSIHALIVRASSKVRA